MQDKKKEGTPMVEERPWEEFRNTGLVLFINSVLHVFGWAIMFKFHKDGTMECVPARCKFRGFDEKSTAESYSKITKYLKENIDDLEKDLEL